MQARAAVACRQRAYLGADLISVTGTVTNGWSGLALFKWLIKGGAPWMALAWPFLVRNILLSSAISLR